MSKFDIKMPKLGESITEGTIRSWSVKVGDIVKEDDVLFEVETVKVSAEIPSPVAGTILEILYKEGDTIAVGVVVAIIEMEGEQTASSEDASEPKSESNVVEEAKEAPAKEESVSAPKSAKEDESKWLSPVVLGLIDKYSLTEKDLNSIVGTGYLGRLTKRDLINYNLNKGTDKANKQEPVAPQQKSTSQPVGVSSIAQDSRENTVVEMNTIRRITSERMIFSQETSAHVTTVVEVDVTKLVQWREKIKNQFAEREGISLTYVPAIVAASAKALIEFPQINASVDGTRIVMKKDINIGIAVALEEWNLIVPVIHNADKLNISGLAHSIDSLAKKARSNKLKMDEVEGGTFTITNFGSFKNIFGTPIINQPEVAILGVGYIEKKPSVIETPEGDLIGIRHKMYLSLSYDHRIVDGALGGAFLKHIADLLEDWTAPI